MKFANFYYMNENNNIVNYGDWLIAESKRYILNKMGVTDDEIIQLTSRNINEYSGELICIFLNVIIVDLPVNIIPCYISLVTVKKLSNIEVTHLKKYAPVGCRDYFTLQECLKNGIDAYFSDCTTIVLPQKKSEIEFKNKIFLVDLPKDAEKFLPSSIINDAVYQAQEAIYTSFDKIDDMYRNFFKNLDEAKLVITSRLHCYMYCLSQKIPCIVMRETYSSRYTLIDRFTNVYDRDMWAKINFEPKIVEIDDTYKQSVIKSISSRLWEVVYKSSANRGFDKIQSIYLNCQKKNYTSVDNHIENIISKKLPDRNFAFNYSIWGVSIWAEATIEFLLSNYPNASLVNVYDAYREVDFYGFRAKSIELLKKNINSEICFICCGENNIDSRLDMVEKLALPEDKFIIVDLYKYR
jgi:hypothetical protein